LSKHQLIFSDANTNLGKESVRRIVNLFNDSSVGCSGEKQLLIKQVMWLLEQVKEYMEI
jgi:cellulose synthase/poly-beta-1,6-N-acetylglucosamine synthase-like glycosyltransferase